MTSLLPSHGSGDVSVRDRLDAERRARIALLLAPTVEVFEALICGESVPVEQLDQSWIQRLALRPGVPSGGHHAADDFNRVPSASRQGERMVLTERGDLSAAGGAS